MKHLEEYKIGKVHLQNKTIESFSDNIKLSAYDNLSDHTIEFKVLYNDSNRVPKLNILDAPLVDVILLASSPPVHDSTTEILSFFLAKIKFALITFFRLLGF